MIYSGMREMAGEAKATLIGGDTMASRSGLILSITVIGDAPRQRVLFRKGARPGDAIYVTGALGGSALGLACLRKGLSGVPADRFIRRHLHPRPRLKAGQMLAASGVATAMIDISDGLVSDLGLIARESGVGFELQAPLVPLEEGLKKLAPQLGQEARPLALSGGEDYELLFTIRSDRIREFETGPKKEIECGATRIGTVQGDAGTQNVLDERGHVIKLERKGFDHFRP
jgi:thiamine-monophosphate kinase